MSCPICGHDDGTDGICIMCSLYHSEDYIKDNNRILSNLEIGRGNYISKKKELVK